MPGSSSLIGRIAVDFVANTGKLLGPVKKAQGAIGGFAAKVAGMGATLGKVVAPIAAVAASYLSLHLATSKVRRALQDIDKIAKQADRLGIGTEELVSLQHAASIAGVSVEQLGTALEYAMRQGKSIKDIELLADQFAAMEDPVKRMQLTMKTFGRSGAGMVNVLMGGSKYIREMREEAEQLGITFTRLDAAKVEAANDAVTRMKEAFDGLARTIAIWLAPRLEWLSAAVQQLAFAARQMGADMADMASTSSTTIGALTDAVQVLAISWKRAEVAATGFLWATKMVETALFPTEANIIFAETLKGQLDEARKELGRMLADPWWSDAIAERIRSAGNSLGRQFRGEQENMIGTPPLDMAALERGSQQAFTAIARTMPSKNTDDQLLLVNNKQLTILQNIERRGLVLAGAGLEGTN